MPIKEYPILGFAPDLPPDTPGILTASSQTVPTDRGICYGYYTAPYAGALTGESCGVAYVSQINATKRLFIGTPTKLYELVGTTPTDRSGTAYSASNGQTWSFSQFGDVTLAVNKGDTLQQINAGSTFAAVSGAPKASIVVTVGMPNASFAMCFDYNDGVNNYQDGVYWSALGDYTNWTTSIATQCGNIRITDINGAWTAAFPFRDGVIAFKSNAMYRGAYVGGSDMWAWERISDTVGCFGKRSVLEVEGALWFADLNGVWVYDGSYPRPAPGYIHRYWATHASGSANDYVHLMYEPGVHRVWFGYGCDGSINNPSSNYLVFNTRSGLWTQYGKLTNGSNQAVSELAYGATYGALGGTSTQFVSTNWGASNLAASFTMGAVGSPYGKILLRGIRPNWLQGGTDTDTTWCSATVYHGPSLRNIANATVATVTTGAPGRFDVSGQGAADNFLQPSITLSAGATWEVAKVSMDITPAGAE